MINVLQSMILTDKEKMIVTSTYYIYEMFVPHHDATLPSEDPNDVKLEPFTAAKIVNDGFTATASPKTVIAIELK